MATGTIELTPESAVLPDASASNAAPQRQTYKGTNTAPAVHGQRLLFDASTAEHAWFKIPGWPEDYASGGTIKIKWGANATTGNCVWAARLGAITAGDADTYLEHAPAAASTVTTGANATEARRAVESSITLANLDSVAVGDLVYVVIYRDAANGSDTLSVDAEFLGAVLTYTTT